MHHAEKQNNVIAWAETAWCDSRFGEQLHSLALPLLLNQAFGDCGNRREFQHGTGKAGIFFGQQR